MADYEKSRTDIAAEEGFTGTFQGFIEWLGESLIYGGLRVHDPAPDQWGRLSTTIETFTGGFSSDEHLLGRLRFSLWLTTNWVRSERGGLDVYEFPDWLVNDPEEREWLEPDRGLVNDFYRVRTVRVYDRHDRDYVELAYDKPIEVVLLEPNFDVMEPNATLIIRPHRNPLPDPFAPKKQS
ncbi:hypothetical protein ACFVU2_19135 [Leifsonia sp. NPDC058194]|uniref:hypothetical protein n=1 Tax=Leifsonia sp. NPDC058194 TaxID=3346374 RepID=UPI0036D7794B